MMDIFYAVALKRLVCALVNSRAICYNNSVFPHGRDEEERL